MKNFKVLTATLFICALLFVRCEKQGQSPLIDFSKMSLEELYTNSAIKDFDVIEELDYMKRHDMVSKEVFNEVNATGVIQFILGENTDLFYPAPIGGAPDMIIGRKSIQDFLKEEKVNIQSGVSEDRKNRHWDKMYSNGTINVSEHLNLPVEWKVAVSEACDAWNALGYNVHFIPYCSSNNNFLPNVLDIDYGSISDGSVYAQTEMSQVQGKFAEKITVNSTFTGGSVLPGAKKITIAHEIGHAIGLGHTNTDVWLQVPNVPCAQLPNSPGDPYSVMRPSYPTYALWLGFTSCDKAVIDYYW